MRNLIVDRVLERASSAKSESDFTYFFSLLLLGEAISKTVVAGLLAALADDPDRNRYRLEHKLVRADGIGEWAQALEDALIGPASQLLFLDARAEQMELTRNCRRGDWQYEAVAQLKRALKVLAIESRAEAQQRLGLDIGESPKQARPKATRNTKVVCFS